MLKYPFCVKQDSYNITPDDGVLMQELEGGSPRFEPDVLGGVWQVSCSTVLLEATDRQKFIMFYRAWQRQPSMPFLVDLIANTGMYEEYKCWFVPASVSIGSFNGTTCQVTFQLFVNQAETDDEVDDAILSGAGDVIDPLEKLVNQDMDEALKTL